VRLLLEYFLYSGLQIILIDLSLTFSLSLFLLMKLVEIFGVLKNFCQKISMSCFFSSLLAVPHILLESVKGFGFLFILRESLSSFVKLSINQLPGIHYISKSLSSNIIYRGLGHLKIVYLVMENLRPQFLLKLIQLIAL